MEHLAEYQPDDIIRVVNPADYDFEFKVDGAPYVVKAGQQALLLARMAELYVEHLSSRMMQEAKLTHSLRDKMVRKQWVDKLIIGLERAYEPAPVQSATDATAQKLAELNPEDLQEAKVATEPAFPQVKRGRKATA